MIMLRKLLAHTPRFFNSGGACRYGLGIAWAPTVRPIYTRLDAKEPEMQMVRQWQIRLSWGQLALWRNHHALIDWRNPFVWRTRDVLRNPA